ncbi:uncharacterized protein [Argopecten irradians]|uniref:uncharacterized protein n=1 Tax=Argopecten irradians TaxID=31199 RepID=UPI00371E4003
MSAASHLNNALTSHNIDICGISEHWLLEEQRYLFQSIHGDFDSHLISDFSLHPMAQNRRCKGGVALLWRKRLSSRVTAVDSDDDRIAILKLTLNSEVIFFIQVYFPTTRYGAELYSEYIAKLNDLCSSFLLEGSVVILGDVKARLSGPRMVGYENHRGHLLPCILDRNQLYSVTTSSVCKGPLFTYVHSEDGSSSLIDHIIIQVSKTDFVKECRILGHIFLNVSNHRPIVCELCFSMDIPTTCEQLIRFSYKWTTSDDIDHTSTYRDTLDNLINASDLRNRDMTSENDVTEYTKDITCCLYSPRLKRR